MMMDITPEDKKSKNAKRIKQLEIEVSILRSAYFQLEKVNLARKKAEVELKKSERKFRKLFESASNLIQNVGPNGVFIDVNPAWCELMGYSREEALKMNLMDVIHPKSQELYKALFKKVKAGKSVDDIEAEFVTKEGKVIVVSGNASCIFEKGKPSVIWIVFSDITEYKKTEQEILKRVKELEKFYRVTVDRELKMVELKGKIEELEKQLDEPSRSKVTKVESNLPLPRDTGAMG